MDEDIPVEQPVPQLPQYPNANIQKPGMMAKMLTKMMKLPKAKMRAPRVAKTKQVKRKNPHFY